MTEELPPIWALDKAAKAAGFTDWTNGRGWMRSDLQCSVAAHARTIAQYEQPPIDEDGLALKRVLNCTDFYDDDAIRDLQSYTWWPTALAQFKRELENRK